MPAAARIQQIIHHCWESQNGVYSHLLRASNHHFPLSTNRRRCPFQSGELSVSYRSSLAVIYDRTKRPAQASPPLGDEAGSKHTLVDSPAGHERMVVRHNYRIIKL